MFQSKSKYFSLAKLILLMTLWHSSKAWGSGVTWKIILYRFTSSHCWSSVRSIAYILEYGLDSTLWPCSCSSAVIGCSSFCSYMINNNWTGATNPCRRRCLFPVTRLWHAKLPKSIRYSRVFRVEKRGLLTDNPGTSNDNPCLSVEILDHYLKHPDYRF